MMLNREVEYRRMACVEERHWWYRSLHSLVLETLEKCKVHHDAEIMDAGCGTGRLLAKLRESGYRHIRGFDLSEVALRYCSEKKLEVFLGDITKVFEHPEPEKLEVIICNDVLCYYRTDQVLRITTGMAKSLKRGGLCLVNMPSFRAFGGIHDISVGIKYRYTHRNTWDLFDHGLFSLLRHVYWPLVLSVPILLARTWQRLRLEMNPRTEIKSDIALPPGAVNELLRIIVQMENRFLVEKPFGSSLFLVLRKK